MVPKRKQHIRCGRTNQVQWVLKIEGVQHLNDLLRELSAMSAFVTALVTWYSDLWLLTTIISRSFSTSVYTRVLRSAEFVFTIVRAGRKAFFFLLIFMTFHLLRMNSILHCLAQPTRDIIRIEGNRKNRITMTRVRQ